MDEAALLQRDGIGVVYLPLIANENIAPGFDPFAISTWRREITRGESENLIRVAEVSLASMGPDIS